MGSLGFRLNLEADDVGIEGVEEVEEGAVLGYALPEPVHIVSNDLHLFFFFFFFRVWGLRTSLLQISLHQP